MSHRMTQGSASPLGRSNAYNFFVLTLTIISLIIMVAMFLPLHDATVQLLQSYDVLICIFFLLDFLIVLKASPHKLHYFTREGGWLDLLGSLPVFGTTFRYASLIRLARLRRAYSIAIMLRGKRRGELIRDVLENRSQYASFLIILLAIFIISFSSVLVLQFESASPDAKIVTGWDAFWYSIVTITTVGYGDYYPVTVWGRITAIFIMVAGMGIIGALASLMATLLIGESHDSGEQESESAVEKELAVIREELASLRRMLERQSMDDIQK
jgi:voltage-gated potassium channel